jgi:hypothetical protein
MRWRLHFLEAKGSLEPWRSALTAETEQIYRRIEDALAPDIAMPPVDILIQRLPDLVIPELGFGGSCFRSGCITVTLDPDNANYESSLAAGELSRTLTHELHHSLRHDGAGYGWTLGEAIVSEGLADHFDREINGGEGRIWNHALGRDRWAPVLAKAEGELESQHYDHGSWFFGTSRDPDAAPRWAGYTIGYHLVSSYIDGAPETRPSRLIDVSAKDIIGRSWVAMKGRLSAAA